MDVCVEYLLLLVHDKSRKGFDVCLMAKIFRCGKTTLEQGIRDEAFEDTEKTCFECFVCFDSVSNSITKNGFQTFQSVLVRNYRCHSEKKVRIISTSRLDKKSATRNENKNKYLELYTSLYSSDFTSMYEGSEVF